MTQGGTNKGCSLAIVCAAIRDTMLFEYHFKPNKKRYQVP
jgi:hypothetical protein